MSLPRYISQIPGTKEMQLKPTTKPDNIPSFDACFTVDPTLLEKWKKVCDDLVMKAKGLPSDKVFKIGICWNASKLAAGVTKMLQRNIPVELMAQLGNDPRVQLFDVFTGRGNESLKITGLPGLDEPAQGFNWSTSTRSFMDTAAVMKCMNLIISCDTAQANLPGTLGVPAFILPPYISDWRWGSDRTAKATPWIRTPGTRVFWQPEPQGVCVDGQYDEKALYEAWKILIPQVAHELKLLLDARM